MLGVYSVLRDYFLKTDPYFLSKPELFIDEATKSGNNGQVPPPRSGHRCFCTSDYFYVVGGYNPSHTAKMLTDIWCLNLMTRVWKRVQVSEQLPDTLASFSLSFVPEIQTFYLYGGTGFPFGNAVSNTLIECRLKKPDYCVVRRVPIEGEECAPKVYGHSAVHRFVYDNIVELYIVGGTEGIKYDMKTTKLTIVGGHARFELLGGQADEPMGRYRHESVLHEDTIICLGGSNQYSAASMIDIDVFDLKTLRYRSITSKPDPVWRYPKARKGHAIVKQASLVYLFGGYQPPFRRYTDGELLSDVWTLNLKTMQWSKFSFQLPNGVFFHSAASNQLNQVLSFGGCAGHASKRVNDTVQFYTGPPTLAYLAACSIVNANPALTKVRHFSYSTSVDSIIDQVMCRASTE